MAKKRSMVGCFLLVVALIFVSTSVYGGVKEVRERYGPGYDRWVGTLIPDEFEFGPEDEVGRLNWMNPASVLKAMRMVKKGKVYDLSFTVDRYSPNWPGHPPYEMITFRSAHGEWNQGDQGWMAPERNEAGIAFASEATIHCQHTGTHMDNIAHVVFGPNACGYNGISLKTNLGDFGLLKGGSETVPPVVCRGILLDMAGYKDMKCLPAGYEITIEDMKGCMRKQGITLQKGDAVLIRTGNGQNWPDKKKSTIGPGPGWKACKWMLDNGMMLAGTDTVAYEVQPTPGNRGPVTSNPHPGHMAMFHHGAHIMEFLNLEKLAQDRVYEFLFMTAPNNFRGATGSNIRPIAIN